MARELRNVGETVRARILERARAGQGDFQILLTRYALERFLYRLSVSEHRDRFMLKGAMLFVAWVADPFRPTRDLDLLGLGDSNIDVVTARFQAICAQPVAEDGVMFDSRSSPASSVRTRSMAGSACGPRRRLEARSFRSRSTSGLATQSRRAHSTSTIP